jgi:hypothetical protein
VANEWTRELTGRQRLQRRLRLWWSGAYTHPDGRIELDFWTPAGIGPSDSDDVQDQKLTAYERRKHERDRSGTRTAGAALLGFVAYSVAHRAGASFGDAVGLGLMVAYGLHLLTRS